MNSLFQALRPHALRNGRAMLARLVREAIWAPVAVILLYYLAQAGAYRSYNYWGFHLLGGCALSYFFYRSTDIVGSALGVLKPLGRYVLAFGCACTVAVFWEIAEFAYDRWMGTRMQRDLAETMIDLTVSVLGAAVALLLIAGYRRLRRRRR